MKSITSSSVGNRLKKSNWFIVHFVWLHHKGRDYNNAGVNSASSRNSVMTVCRYVVITTTRLKGIIPFIKIY